MKKYLVLLTVLVVGCTQKQKLGPAPYDQPPRNTLPQILDAYVAALNSGDSAGYWHLHLWEASELDQSRRQVRTIWDSTRGTRVSLALLNYNTFQYHVHSPTEQALFANAFVVFSDSARAQRDTLRALLRVDSGLWRMGQLSADFNKPYKLEPMKY